MLFLPECFAFMGASAAEARREVAEGKGLKEGAGKPAPPNPDTPPPNFP